MNEYRRDAKGTLIRILPRKFRRGRAWVKGQLSKPERFKHWILNKVNKSRKSKRAK